MTEARKKTSITEGPIFFRMLLYAIPIMLTGILQLLYNIADNVIVGQFSGNPLALAAVGSTSSLGNLIINLLMGIAGGAGVLVAQQYGAKRYDALSRSVHTAMFFSLFSGIAFAVLSFFLTRPALILMQTKAEILDLACLYLQIISIGVPASAVYNFGAAILRSVGDSKTPLYVLSASGIVNVILNVFFVLVCGMSVDGVAIATIVAQYISAVAIVVILARRKSTPYAIRFRELGIDFPILGRILHLGIPAGLQSTLFSISNIILTAGVNTLPTTDISAKTIAINIEGLVYSSMNSYLHAAMTFTGQNYGAKSVSRIKRSILCAVTQVSVIGLLGGFILIYNASELAGMYVASDDPNRAEIIKSTVELMTFMLSTYFLCGVMDALSGSLRGLGYSMTPMLTSIFCVCGLRLLWIFFAFPTERFNSLIGIYTIYPISWLIAALIMAIVLIVAIGKIKRKIEADSEI